MPFTKGETNNAREQNRNRKKIKKTGEKEKEKEQIEQNDPVTASL